MCATSRSEKPTSWSRCSIRRWTASHGVRRRAPIIGGPNDSLELVKTLDERDAVIYRQGTLPPGSKGPVMQTTTREEIKVGPLAIRFLVEGEESGGSVAVFEFDVPAGHSHDGYEETVYGLEGVLTWTVEGIATDVGPGDTLCIPRGAVHQFENPHAVDARTLAIVTPGILGPDYFREVAAILDAAAGGAPDFAALGEVMTRHG